MADIYLHPTACRRDVVAAIQRRTGLVAAITGPRVQLVTAERWANQFLSPRIQSRFTGPGAA